MAGPATRLRILVFAVPLMVAPLFAQIGQYPGSRLPGQYPGPNGGPDLPFPWPRRGKQGGHGGSNQPEAVTRTDGRLQKIDAKSIVMKATDGRVLEFQRTDKTKFYKESKEIAVSELKPGDEISVEGTEDEQGYLHARAVHLLKSAEDSAPVEESHDSYPPAPPDKDDPGPPVLKRGIPPKQPHGESEESVSYPAEAAPASPEPADPLIGKARSASAAFSERLPNYVCKEFMARFASSSRPADWEALDVVSTDVVYEDGRESYRSVAVNGKATHKPMEELGGAWSTGEFATVLQDLFSPATGAEFHFRHESDASGIRARVYDFEVEQARSHWHVQVASQSINPAYKGSVWIEPESGRVLRIEMQARHLPEEFPLDTVESAVDYDKVRIGNSQFLLPVHAESLSCQRGTSNCTRNTIDFRNYHAYEASSSVAFENKLTPDSGGGAGPPPARFRKEFATGEAKHTSNKWAARRGAG